VIGDHHGADTEPGPCPGRRLDQPAQDLREHLAVADHRDTFGGVAAGDLGQDPPDPLVRPEAVLPARESGLQLAPPPAADHVVVDGPRLLVTPTLEVAHVDLAKLVAGDDGRPHTSRHRARGLLSAPDGTGVDGRNPPWLEPLSQRTGLPEAQFGEMVIDVAIREDALDVRLALTVARQIEPCHRVKL
jgi:hypothetical protein